MFFIFFFSSRRRHTRCGRDWSSDVCSSDLHVIKLSEQTRIDNGRFFDDMSQVPTHAITMGMADIAGAKEIALVITGKHKAETVLQLFESPITEQMPASMLKQHNNTHFLIDEAAASLLPKEAYQYV